VNFSLNENVVPCYLFHFQNLKIALHGRIKNITIMQAKFQDILAEFETIHFTNCFEWWLDGLAA